MKAAVVVFPASNCDRDSAVALESLSGVKPAMVWHGDSELPDVDLVVLPGGFAYGDYLRCGAMAAQSRIMRDLASVYRGSLITFLPQRGGGGARQRAGGGRGVGDSSPSVSLRFAPLDTSPNWGEEKKRAP